MKNKKTLLSILAKHEKNLIVYQHMVSSSNENKTKSIIQRFLEDKNFEI